ncbi:MAG TPA: cupredoxin domain-containing protein [Candidatus Limnocylindrales bacterium]
MHRRLRAALLVAPLLAVGALAACGPAGPDPLATFNGASLTIEARGLAFDPVIATMPAGQPLRLILDNQDAGVEHNIHVFRGDTDYGTTSSVIGPGLAALELPAMAAGSYQFECTLHPDMIGTLVVAAGATVGPSPADDSAAPGDSLAPLDSGAPFDSAAPGDSASPSQSAAPVKSTAPGQTKAPARTPSPSATKR